MLEGINIIFFIFVLILGLVAFLSGGVLLFQTLWGFRRKINESLNMELVLVRVAATPKSEKEREDPDRWKSEIRVMEQLLTTLAKTKRKHTFWGRSPMMQITLEIANPSNSEEIFFYVSFPKRYLESIEKQIHSFYPDAMVEVSSDYTIFRPKSFTSITTLKLHKSQALPLFTYEEMDVDPLNELSNALSKLETIDEGAAVQLVLHPAGDGWRSKGREIAHKMQQGKRLKDVYGQSVALKTLKDAGSAFSDVLLTSSSDKNSLKKENASIQLTPEEQELIKAIERKTSKVAYKVNIRLLASANTQERADQILAQMENSFAQFERSDINYFKVRNRTGKKQIAFDYIMRLFQSRNAILLGVEEISSIFHFPISTTQTPKIKWLKAGTAAPPPNIPKEGLVLGYSDYRGTHSDIRLSDNDRRRHLYTIGQTGVGKSVFLQEMAKQDIRNGKGVCFIDPHGDAVEDIMAAIPKERVEDIIYFDPSDMERPFGLNMLEYYRPEEKTFVINEMINIFDKLYDLKQTGGPMFEQYMRNAMLLVMEDPESGSTLLEIPRVLADEEFRRYKLSRCPNPVVKDFWIKEAEKAGGEAALANMVPYITSKLTQFISNDMMRPIISQQVSTINFRKLMDEGKILLINLSKGKIGETNSYLLGMVIVGKILMAALSRSDMAEKDRRDFYLYIDEFQNVTTDSIAQILSEARKYHLNLTIAHQFIGQLSEEISKAVFGNVGSLCVFRVGPEDAEFLEKQFAPVFHAEDMVNVDNYNCFVRVLINNEATKPFNIKAYPPTEGNLQQVSLIKQLSRLRFGRDVKIVNEEVRRRIEVRPSTQTSPVHNEAESLWPAT